MKEAVYNLKGDKVGDIELNNAIFGRPWNPDLVHQALRVQSANARHPWAHVKGRGEVRGGGRKPWRQKHTGRARHGSIRSPLWKGGGVTHGPLKQKNYHLKINKKMLRLAIYSALSKKLADQELKIVDSLKIDSPKTKKLAADLGIFLKTRGFLRKSAPGLNALLVPAAGNKTIYLASRNIPKVKSLTANSLNLKEILQYKNMIIDQGAISEIW